MGDMELEIDESMLRSVVRDQHPDLGELPLALVDGGDNQMWRLGEELGLRLPRTPRADALLRVEGRWLPDLAPVLTLPVPTPVRVGEPSEYFPRPWTVARWVAGEPGDRAPIRDGEHAAFTLARFLRALHTEAPSQAPRNPVRGVPLSVVGKRVHERLDAVVADVDAIRLGHVWDQAASAPSWGGPAALAPRGHASREHRHRRREARRRHRLRRALRR